MSIGSLARTVLGPYFPIAGRIYRSAFVDLRLLAQAAAPLIPPDAHILDVGGGDGEPLNHILALRPDVTVTMTDLNPAIGLALRPEFRSRVELRASTSVLDYLRSPGKAPNVVMLNDVMHHVRPHERAKLLGQIQEIMARFGTSKLLIKDVEPGHFRSALCLWTDRHITGDKGVELVSREELDVLMRRACGECRVEESLLFEKDPPNYLVAYSFARPAQA